MAHNTEVEINGVPIKWNLEQGTFTFNGLKSALFWINPSLLTMLQPIADEIGHELFKLMVANSSSQGTYEDYQFMITQLGNTFEEGFTQWGKAVSTAGWGTFELSAFDEENKTARVRLSNTWELLLGSESANHWGSPFIQGKLIGIFSQAFNKSCWADEVDISYNPENAFVEYFIHESEKTITAEIEALKITQMQEKERKQAIEIKKKTSDLHNSESRFRQLAEMSSDWVWEMDEKLRFSYFSGNYHRHTGYDPHYSFGKTRNQLTPEEDLKKGYWQKHLSDLENKRAFRNFQYEFIGPDGVTHHLQISGSPVYDENDTFTGYRGTASDITEKVNSVMALEQAKKEAEKNLDMISELNLQLQTEIAHKNQALTRLNYVNMYDNLTETPNRSQIKNIISKLQENSNDSQIPIGLMLINLNEMELINLQYGLDVGDTVLVEASILIKGTIKNDDLISRSSGSDFIVFFPDCPSVDQIERTATQIIDNLSPPFESVPNEKITASIGILIHTGEKEPTDKLLSIAYSAMLEAKKMGPNKFITILKE